MRRLIAELVDALGVKRSKSGELSQVFEDNHGALTLANTEMPLSTPRTKHYAIELHWFHEHCIPGQISIEANDKKLQLADIFTKGLEPTKFEPKRKMIVGW